MWAKWIPVLHGNKATLWRCAGARGFGVTTSGNLESADLGKALTTARSLG